MFLRSIGRPLLAKVKQTTGIVGLDVVSNARAVLIDLYTKTLKEIQAVPEDEGYRKAVESFTRHRLNVCKEEEDWEAIEKQWDPWGVPDDYECEVIENDAPIPKHVPQHRPGPLPEDFYRTLEGLISESKTKIPAASSTDPLLKE
uniref:Uncharacterized protein n=1 Tax=Brassica oleracea TaxID=3712 RepID=A0A3P6E6L2_BRAOL|nr:unnamed protein product [Brassica oleracea]